MIVVRVAIWLALAAGVGGCGTTRPVVPDGYRVAESQTETLRVATAVESGAELPPGVFPVAPLTPPKMQIIVAYGPVTNTHAAMRLEAGQERIVFWDPGGNFGRRHPQFNRVNDVMTGPHATLQRIWHYRRSECRNNAMAVFEFDYPAEYITSLQDLLVRSARSPGDPDAFATATTPSQCAANLSKFLRERSPNRPYVDGGYFYPHSLGEHLWKQNPDRVLLFSIDAPPRVLVPARTASSSP